MVRLQMFFDVDMPTTVENKLREEFQGEPGVREELRLTGRELYKQCPAVMHWIVQNGYADQDLVLTVGTKEENGQVEEPVAQYP